MHAAKKSDKLAATSALKELTALTGSVNIAREHHMFTPLG